MHKTTFAAWLATGVIAAAAAAHGAEPAPDLRGSWGRLGVTVRFSMVALLRCLA